MNIWYHSLWGSKKHVALALWLLVLGYTDVKILSLKRDMNNVYPSSLGLSDKPSYSSTKLQPREPISLLDFLTEQLVRGYGQVTYSNSTQEGW